LPFIAFVLYSFSSFSTSEKSFYDLLGSFLSLLVKREEVNSMATKLYVGGLPYSTQEDALKELFAQAGSVVSAVIIMDKMSGRSKGFGFVEMANDEEAQKAVSMFNDQEFEGRKLTVNEARPMEARPPRTGGNGGYGGGNGGYGGGNRGGRREY
jgi:RNA recognition motif-containing protein